MAKRVVKQKPCRIRYEQSHPTVSFRIKRPIYDRLKAAIGNLGWSFADWVKVHLDKDDQRVLAAAERLAREHDGLGRQIDKRRQELSEVEKQVQQRNQQLSVSMEEEKARRFKELDKWFVAEKERLKQPLAGIQTEVNQARDGLAKEQERLQALRADVAIQQGLKTALEKANAQLEERTKQWQMEMERATKLINQYPWLFCRQCPGSAMAQNMLVLVNNLIPLIEKAPVSPNSAGAQAPACRPQLPTPTDPQAKPSEATIPKGPEVIEKRPSQ